MRFIAFAFMAIIMMATPVMAGEMYKCRYANDAGGPIKDYDYSRHDVDKRDVKALQMALGEAGYKSGPIDGVYGPITTRAVRAYQADRNMTGDGKLTARTLRALKITSWCGYDHRLHRNYN